MTPRCVRVLVAVLTLASSMVIGSAPARAGSLKVGAARVDITPPPAQLPEPYLTIHDHIFARAIVLDNGTARAALVSADVSGFPDAAWADLSSKIAAELGCPVEHVLISGTHTHSSPPPGGRAGRPAGAPLDPHGAAHGARVVTGALDAVRQAVARLQPARVGFGTGQFHANVNRDAIDPATRLWYQGPNLDGPSDKAVAVVTFESLAGAPIAVYANYGMHAVFFFMRNQISADFPGAASRHIEQAFGDEVVAIWTSGAAGDQNPLYLRLSEPAVAAEKRTAIKAAGGPENPSVWEVADFRGASLSSRVLEGNAAIVQAVGTLLGEEVIRVMGSVRDTSDTVRLWGARTTVTCPGRQRTNAGREGAPGTYVDADPVNARSGLLMIGQVAIGSLGAEPYSLIGQRLKKASPFPHTMLVTIANGTSAGYIPTDDAYGRYTFQVLGSRFKPGCGETGVVNALLGMMRQYSAQAEGAVSLAGLDLWADKTDIERLRIPLEPGFSPSSLSYAAAVDATYTATAFITPVVLPGASVRLRINDAEVTPGEPHKVSLSEGVNSFRITLAPAGGGPESTYRLSVTRRDLSREYRSESIGAGMWRIRDFGGTIGNQDMYLIEGRERALLFDTGMGRGDLAGFVRSLTKLPVDVAITHGNRDHFLQVDQFPGSTVYMSHKDVTRLPPELVTPRYRWVKDGDRLDLGGRSFSVIEVAGHSLGSVVYLDEAHRIAITGDAISSGSMVYVFAPTCTALDQYLASLRGLEDKVKHLDGLTLLVGHHYQERTPLTGAAGKQLITDMRTAAERVLRGELEGRPAQTVRDGRPVDLRQANVGLAGLWYNPKNLATDPAALGLLEVRTVAGAPVIPSPIFSSFQTTYTAKVPAAVTRLELVPTAYDPAHRAITVNGTRVPSGGRYDAPVRPGPNRFDIVVTAERGTSRTYTLVVTMEAAGSQ